MKKFFFLIISISLMMAVSAFAYTERKVISDVGIPKNVSYIQFDNGGRVMLEAENAEITIEVHTNESKLTFSSNGNPIQFYVYVVKAKKLTLHKSNGTAITSENKTVKVVDSESLAIMFIE